MSQGLSVLAQGREFHIEIPTDASSASLLQSVYLSGLFEPPPLCAGLALCGRCRMRFAQAGAGLTPPPLPDDIKALGRDLTEQGWRLACRHKAVPGARLELPEGVRVLDGACAEAGPPGPARKLAVDFGSTSLHYAEVTPGAAQEAPLNATVLVNPQMGAGSDIISRLAYAQRQGGGARLAEVSQSSLRYMVKKLGNIDEICLAANPAMTYLLLGKDVSGLAAAPYHLDYRGGRREELPGLPPIWTAPLMGPFMGGDLSAGYAAIAWSRENLGMKVEYPFVLADMGTNGEFILALSAGEALAASLPLGPALEGIGMSCGSEAREGVVTGFALGSDGLVPQMFGQSGPTRGLSRPPVGLSGTAYLSLAGHLLRQGIILPSGLFADAAGAPPSPLAARLARALRDGARGRAFYLMDTLYMTGADVEELLKIKAAFSLALKLLLAEAGIGFSALKALYLAGSLGSHVDITALEALGFIPPGGGAKAVSAGNSSLTGAALLCRQPDLRERLNGWAAKVRVLSLTDNESFQADYTDEMKFAW